MRSTHTPIGGHLVVIPWLTIHVPSLTASRPRFPQTQQPSKESTLYWLWSDPPPAHVRKDCTLERLSILVSPFQKSSHSSACRDFGV
jgi:hypothetical protein